MWGFLSALISGALMSIQGVFNTNVQNRQVCGFPPDGCSFPHFWSVWLHGFLQVGKVSVHCGRWRINIRCLEA